MISLSSSKRWRHAPSWFISFGNHSWATVIASNAACSGFPGLQALLIHMLDMRALLGLSDFIASRKLWGSLCQVSCSSAIIWEPVRESCFVDLLGWSFPSACSGAGHRLERHCVVARIAIPRHLKDYVRGGGCERVRNATKIPGAWAPLSGRRHGEPLGMTLLIRHEVCSRSDCTRSDRLQPSGRSDPFFGFSPYH